MTVVVDPGTGVHLHSFDASGNPVSGFPLRLSMDVPIHGASLAVGQNDSVYILGKELYGVTSMATAMPGFPKRLPSLTQGSFQLSTNYQPVLTATPNGLYVPGELDEHMGSKGGIDVAVQGLTLDGTQRALFPRFTGTSGDDAIINAVVDASDGSLWVLWKTGTGIAQLTRFSAN